MESTNGNIFEDNLAVLTLSEIVKKNYKAAAVFEKFGLDFCCRGNKLISNACEEKGISKEELTSELSKLDEQDTPSEKFDNWELDFLSEYIINVHHKYIRDMIPVVSAHTDKVASVHGKNHPETIKVANNFSIVYKDLKQHMMKEEQILFPYIKYLVKTKNNSLKAEQPYFGTIKNPIRMMESEHESAGDLLYEIRKLTNNYSAPEDACNTYKVLYKELKDFEEDLHQHVHLENYILFPKSVQLEEQLLNG